MTPHRSTTVRLATVRLAVLAGGVGLAALAGCSSSGGTAASPPPSTTSAAPSTAVRTTTVAPTATTTETTSGGPGGQDGQVQACRESQLRASIDPRGVEGSGMKGEMAVIVDFRNTSDTACTLHGYPGAALVDSHGTQVTQATRTIRGRLLGLPVGQNSLPTATLAPGAYASAGLEGVDKQEYGAAQAGCDNAYYPRILVTPPNTRTAVPFTVRWPRCYSFTVHPTNIEKNPPA